MSDLTCPHCRGSVPRGATVCRGCQAEVTYGGPRSAFLALAVASLFLGFQTAAIVPVGVKWFGWVIGLGALFGGSVWLNNLFKDRVRFRRIYRTR